LLRPVFAVFVTCLLGVACGDIWLGLTSTLYLLYLLVAYMVADVRKAFAIGCPVKKEPIERFVFN